MEIKTFSPKDHFLKVLIYGASKSGKTTFAGTAKNAVFASAEGGLLSIADKHPNYAKIETLRDLNDFYLFLRGGKHEYKTVIIDSLTEINDIIKAGIEKKTGHPMEQRDWGEHTEAIMKLLRDFRGLPMNVIFIATEKYISDEDKIKKIVPMIDGKAATKIAQFMDVVAYIHVENDGRSWIEVTRNKKLLTGDRSRALTNDMPMDFEAWLASAQNIEVGKEEVKTTFSAPVTPQAPSPKPASTPKPRLKELQIELMARGAADKNSAIVMLNNCCGTSYMDFSTIDEVKAGDLLVMLLQVPTKKQEAEEEEKEPPATYNLQYNDHATVTKFLSGLNLVREVGGLKSEIDNLYDGGEMTEANHQLLTNLCLARMAEINDGLSKPKKAKKGKK